MVVFDIIDGSFMLWFIIAFIHFVILKLTWAEDVWRPGTDTYYKRSTKKIRRRMIYHMVLSAGLLLLSMFINNVVFKGGL